MTSSLSTGNLGLSDSAGGESRNVLQEEALRSDPDRDHTLTEVMLLVDMRLGASRDGWNRESARLFAIDTAMTVLRRHLDVISEADRQTLSQHLAQSRALVVGERDGELAFIQAAVESQLSLLSPGRERQVWLTVMDALIPSPYRAALVTVRNALASEPQGPFGDLGPQLRARLTARLGEGSLLSEPSSTLFLIA